MKKRQNVLSMKMKIASLTGVLVFFSNMLLAQLSGTFSVPATYSSIALAVNELNVQGVSGAVTIVVDAGHTETVPAGGITFTATGTSLNTITFAKNGSGPNPLLVAFSGVATPASANQDGVWKFVGSDYVTIDGIDILDPNASNPQTMEFGYGFFKASSTNGCQNNTIRNCVITLKTINNGAGSGPAADGSRGINVANSLVTSQITNLTVASLNGANSKNRFYSNTIQNCNIGIALMGFASVSPYSTADQFNDVGGSSLLTGNNIINFGGSGSSVPAAGIRTLNQHNLNVAFNNVVSNTIDPHSNILRGIFVGASAGASSSILNNTVTVAGGGTTQLLAAIENNAGTTASNNTVTISNNLITGCSYSTASIAPFYGIFNSASASYLAVENNTISSNSTKATGGNQYVIYNSGAIALSNSISNNHISNLLFSASNTTLLNYNIYNAAAGASSSLTIAGNYFQGIAYAGTASGAWGGIVATGSSSVQVIQNNTFDNLSIKTSGAIYLISSGNTSSNSTISGNSIAGIFMRQAAGSGAFYGIFNNANSLSGNTTNIYNNNFSNINNGTNTGAIQMIYWSINPNLNIYGNSFTNITAASGTANFTGIYAHYYSANTNIYNNDVSNIVYGTGALYGLYFNELNGVTGNVYANNFYSLKNSGTTVTGIFINYSGSNNSSVFNFYRNRISDIGSSSASASGVSGITINSVSGGSLNVYNNLIANITATAASNINAISGINISSASASLTCDVSFNSIYLNSSSSGANFGSSGMAANTGSSLILRNNIIVNKSAPSGTGRTVAFRRNSTNIGTYSTLSNNNLFYAGVPSPTRFIFFNGTNSYQTLATYQSATLNRDGLSVTEDPVFLSTLSSNPDFLKPDPSVATQIENWGMPVAGVTNDFTLTPRNSSTPDLGAWEGNYLSGIPACSGIPPASGVIASASSICAGTPVLLSLSNTYTNTGISIQWELSTAGAGGPYISIPGATVSVYNAAGISTTSWFRAIISCSGSAASTTATPAQVTITGNACSCLSYCTSSATSGSDEEIFNVSISTLNNTSNCSQTGGAGSVLNQYSDYTGSLTVPALVNGATYSLSVTAGQCSGSQWSGRVGVYIDYNHNGLFTDAGEDVLLTSFSPIQISGTTYTTNVIIPQNATLGITRMRVLVAESNVIDPCGTYGIGETEDYCVRIGFPPCAGAPSQNTVTASSFSVCQQGSVVLSLTDSYSVTGLDYQWSSAVNLSGPFIALPGQSSTHTVSNVAASGWYQAVITCTNGVVSTTATPVFITALPEILTSASPNKICPGESVTLLAAGADTYTWSMGGTGPQVSVSPTASTIYTVSGDASGCVGSSTLAVTVHALPGLSLTATSSTVCAGDQTVALSGSPEDGIYSGSFVNGTVFGPAPEGTFMPVYSYTDAATGCSDSTTIQINVLSCTGVNGVSGIKKTKLYPNPVRAMFTVQHANPIDLTIEVLDLTGRKLKSINSESGVTEVDVMNLANGVYVVRIFADSSYEIIKLIKQ